MEKMTSKRRKKAFDIEKNAPVRREKVPYMNLFLFSRGEVERLCLYLPIISKLSPKFEHIHYTPLIIHSGIPLPPPPPPPPDNDRICGHNAMLAFPQEKISHYTTASRPCISQLLSTDLGYNCLYNEQEERTPRHQYLR